jgi:YD repeat-containing protein
MHRARLPIVSVVSLTASLLISASAVAVPSQEYALGGGMPRHYQAAVGIFEGASFNASNANVVLAMPLVYWSCKGSSLHMALYHNARCAVDGLSADAGAGFTLGTGWRITFGGQVVSISGTLTRVIEDDRSVNGFTLVGGVWTPPAGVYDMLTYNAQTGWTLTRKDQSYRVFDATSGRLLKEGDAHGNEITIDYDGSDRIDTITDAAGRALTFAYDGSGRLSTITDPRTPTGRRLVVRLRRQQPAVHADRPDVVHAAVHVHNERSDHLLHRSQRQGLNHRLPALLEPDHGHRPRPLRHADAGVHADAADQPAALRGHVHRSARERLGVSLRGELRRARGSHRPARQRGRLHPR